ncbi:hypothetical protein SDJN03_19977, partial [Cucurbita argyrosperma subsp. sororia]
MPVDADAIAEEIESGGKWVLIQPKSMFHQRSCNHYFQCHLLRVGLLCTSQLHQAIRRNLVQQTNFRTTGCMGGNPLKDSNGSATNTSARLLDSCHLVLEDVAFRCIKCLY